MLKNVLLVGGCVLALAACSQKKEPDLLNVKQTGNGPDEFAILPSKPLTLPDNYNDIPTPTRGGTNRTDPTPVDDAIRALGGNPAAGVTDPALVAYASRKGVTPNIRGELAKEDLEFRRKRPPRVLERVFDVNVYYNVYEPQTLDQYQELERLRRRGIKTVSAPPQAEE